MGDRVLVGGWGDLLKVTGTWWWRSSTRPGPGSRQGSGGTIRRWMCRERTCQTVTLLEHSEKVCAPRAGLAPCTRTGWPSAEKTCAPGTNRDARSPSRDSKNAIAYEPGNCPRATLGYRTPQKHSTNSLLPPIDTAGYALVDRLFAYPHARNLSTCEHESALPGIGGTSAPRTRGYSIVTPGPSGGRGPSISTGMRSSVPFGWTT